MKKAAEKIFEIENKNIKKIGQPNDSKQKTLEKSKNYWKNKAQHNETQQNRSQAIQVSLGAPSYQPPLLPLPLIIERIEI